LRRPRSRELSACVLLCRPRIIRLEFCLCCLFFLLCVCGLFARSVACVRDVCFRACQEDGMFVRPPPSCKVPEAPGAKQLRVVCCAALLKILSRGFRSWGWLCLVDAIHYEPLACVKIAWVTVTSATLRAPVRLWQGSKSTGISCKRNITCVWRTI
jgi:hypothetical protein